MSGTGNNRQEDRSNAAACKWPRYVYVEYHVCGTEITPSLAVIQHSNQVKVSYINVQTYIRD